MKRIFRSYNFISSHIRLTALSVLECKLVFNKKLRNRCFLVDIAKLSITPDLQEHLEIPDSVFIEHICNYNIRFNLRHSEMLKCIHVKSKLRER